MRSPGSSRRRRSLAELHAAPGNPGIARARSLPPGTGRGRRGAARSRPHARHRPRRSSGRRRRSSRASPTSSAIEGSRCSAPARGGADRGVEDLRQGRDARRGRADGRDAARARVAPCVVKADGLAAGKGVFVCRTQAELEAGLAEPRLRRAARDRGAARGAGGVAASRCATATRRCRSRLLRTSSAPTTATRGRTRAAWARTRPVPGLDDDEVERLRRRRVHRPVLDGAGAARDARSSGCSSPGSC